MSEPLRWGIIGTGNIARQFTTGMKSSPKGKLVGVGSRSQDSADQFARQFEIASSYPSYDALLADKNVEAIYLSLPNSMHHEWTLKSLRAGKHVLCEKPMATNATQAEEMFDTAQKAGKVLVEAFMYRSHPQTKLIVETIRKGAIGQVKAIRTQFTYRTSKIDQNIRFKPELAGGAMMDIGCYCLSFSRLIAGQEPNKILATGKLHPSGVDEYASVTLGFPNGIVGSFVCGMTLQGDNTAYVLGDEGYLEVGWPWKPQRKATFSIAYSTPPKQDAKGNAAPARPPKQEITAEAHAELYALEGDDFAATVRDGAPPMMSRGDSIGNMKALDEIRRQLGLQF